MSSKQEIVLTSVEQYRSDVLRLPRLTRQEERELVQRARQGNQQAKETLLQSCLRYVASVAYRYVCYLQHDEYLDLVSVGNLALVECLEKALTVENPVAYLLGVAKLAVKAYCCKHSQLITHQWGQPYMWIDSLDAPVGNGQGCLAERLSAPTQEPQEEPADCDRLYRAIDALTPKQRYVILRHFGLDGDTPEPIAAISKRLSHVNPKQTIARNRYNTAISSLRRKLLHSA
jgi:DNA-directed RNA polymerase sigma subunit (sigma70/sigma32)